MCKTFRPEETLHKAFSIWTTKKDFQRDGIKTWLTEVNNDQLNNLLGRNNMAEKKARVEQQQKKNMFGK